MGGRDGRRTRSRVPHHRAVERASDAQRVRPNHQPLGELPEACHVDRLPQGLDPPIEFFCQARVVVRIGRWRQSPHQIPHRRELGERFIGLSWAQQLWSKDPSMRPHASRFALSVMTGPL
ncbi:MAG: hypothetical protein AAF627_09945 [Myxococcota bacterium]